MINKKVKARLQEALPKAPKNERQVSLSGKELADVGVGGPATGEDLYTSSEIPGIPQDDKTFRDQIFGVDEPETLTPGVTPDEEGEKDYWGDSDTAKAGIAYSRLFEKEPGLAQTTLDVLDKGSSPEIAAYVRRMFDKVDPTYEMPHRYNEVEEDFDVVSPQTGSGIHNTALRRAAERMLKRGK
jgi:hypothetical protein